MWRVPLILVQVFAGRASLAAFAEAVAEKTPLLGNAWKLKLLFGGPECWATAVNSLEKKVTSGQYWSSRLINQFQNRRKLLIELVCFREWSCCRFGLIPFIGGLAKAIF